MGNTKPIIRQGETAFVELWDDNFHKKTRIVSVTIAQTDYFIGSRDDIQVFIGFNKFMAIVFLSPWLVLALVMAVVIFQSTTTFYVL